MQKAALFLTVGALISGVSRCESTDGVDAGAGWGAPRPRDGGGATKDAGVGEACGRTTCGTGQECCNESCGICTEPGGLCTEQFCIDDDGGSPEPAAVRCGPDAACPGAGSCVGKTDEICDPQLDQDCTGACRCLALGLCVAGFTWDDSPGVCDCVASACAAVTCAVGSSCEVLPDGSAECVPANAGACAAVTCEAGSSCEALPDGSVECVPQSGRYTCSLPPFVGPCEALIERWYHDVQSGECETFNYGGCQSNGNNFETKRDCENACN
jgi:hypothetical protein